MVTPENIHDIKHDEVFDEENSQLSKSKNEESISFEEENIDEKLPNMENSPNEIQLRHVPADQNHRDTDETSTINTKERVISEFVSEGHE